MVGLPRYSAGGISAASTGQSSATAMNVLLYSKAITLRIDQIPKRLEPVDVREFFDETANSPDHEGPGCSVVLSFPSQTPPPAFSLRGE